MTKNTFENNPSFKVSPKTPFACALSFLLNYMIQATKKVVSVPSEMCGSRWSTFSLLLRMQYGSSQEQ